jgi:tRNA G18 (ribose-2'-O)-methylase SpoU
LYNRPREQNKKKLFIPNYNNSKAESLNVSIATALVCAEFRRRFSD